MGVTIHYYGHAASEEAVQRILEIAEQFAIRKEWWRHRRDCDGKLLRFSGEGDDIEVIEYEGRVRGIAIIVEPGQETVRFEFDDDLYMQWFTKTQSMRLESHVEIVELLREIEPHMRDLVVVDEGGYWETSDRTRLHELRERNIAHIRQLVWEIRARQAAPDN